MRPTLPTWSETARFATNPTRQDAERLIIQSFTNHFWLDYGRELSLAEIQSIHYSRNDRQPGVPDYADILRGQYELKPDGASTLHRIDSPGDTGNGANAKWVSSDGRSEYVFRYTSQGFVPVLSDLNQGTYNFNGAFFPHLLLDVLPWMIWGNTAADTSMTFQQRASAFFVGGGIDNARDAFNSSYAAFWSGLDSATSLFRIGGSGAETFTPLDRAGTIRARGGDDTMFGGEHITRFYGGDGNDLVSYIDSPTGVTASLMRGQGFDGHARGDFYDSVEHLNGSLFHDILIGDTGGNRLSGLSGNDILYGEGGNDTLYGGAGQDTLYGGRGNDILYGGPGEDLAVFAGRMSNYWISGNFQTQSINVNDIRPNAPQGSNTLYEIQRARFDDGDVDFHFANSPRFTNLSTNGFLRFGANSLPPNDDGSTAAIDITPIFENGIRIGGVTYNDIYLNNNGNVTFGRSLGSFTPQRIGGQNELFIIAPFWADVDTRVTPQGATQSGVFWDLVPNRGSIVFTWKDVGYYNSQVDKLNSFQLELRNKGAGAVEIVFRYEDINWTTGSASGGTGGLGGTPARAGFSLGDTYLELPTSGIQNEMLALESTAGNRGVAGLWQFMFADETVQTAGSAANDFFMGSANDDQFFGLLGNDTLMGGGGDDFLDGGEGNDSLNGGEGHDRLFGGSGDDTLLGGGGNDLLSVSSGNNQLWGNLGQDTLIGGTGHDTLGGGDGNDQLDARAGGVNELWGGSGADTLYASDAGGRAGGGFGADVIYGGNAAEEIFGGAGNDTLTGDGGNDTIFGGLDNDQIFGGPGDDRLVAGPGFDRLWGGAGADRFEFWREFGFNRIEDFNAAEGDTVGLGRGMWTGTHGVLNADQVLSTFGSITAGGEVQLFFAQADTRIVFSGITDLSELSGSLLLL